MKNNLQIESYRRDKGTDEAYLFINGMPQMYFSREKRRDEYLRGRPFIYDWEVLWPEKKVSPWETFLRSNKMAKLVTKRPIEFNILRSKNIPLDIYFVAHANHSYFFNPSFETDLDDKVYKGFSRSTIQLMEKELSVVEPKNFNSYEYNLSSKLSEYPSFDFGHSGYDKYSHLPNFKKYPTLNMAIIKSSGINLLNQGVFELILKWHENEELLDKNKITSSYLERIFYNFKVDPRNDHSKEPKLLENISKDLKEGTLSNLVIV